ncbi:MAG: inositol monophosphatase family protein [Desulfohalobiaceae bacterium]
MGTTPESLVDEARGIVVTAGEIIRENFEKPVAIKHKGSIDLVTETDLAVEHYLKEHLGKLLPKADFLAEETASSVTPGPLTWIIDPIDGTTNYAHGFPFVALSVALWERDRVVMGIVHLPILNETFAAVRGRGASLNGRPIHVSEQNVLQNALMATGFPYDIAQRVDPVLATMRTVLLSCQGVRRAGSAAIDLAYTACGRVDGFYEIGLKPWDTAAGWLLVEEAGGVVTRFDPVREYSLGSFSILAANPGLHAQLGELLHKG